MKGRTERCRKNVLEGIVHVHRPGCNRSQTDLILGFSVTRTTTSIFFFFFFPFDLDVFDLVFFHLRPEDS